MAWLCCEPQIRNEAHATSSANEVMKEPRVTGTDKALP